MNPTSARVVVCLAIFAALAAVAVGWVEEPQFDVVAGPDWAERATAVGTGGGDPSTPLVQARSPQIASGLILLAGGLIVTVVAFATHARSQAGSLARRLVSVR